MDNLTPLQKQRVEEQRQMILAQMEQDRKQRARECVEDFFKNKDQEE